MLITIENGHPVKFTLGKFICTSCCDCGLVHITLHEQTKDKELFSKSYRDDYETECVRAEMPEEDLVHTIKNLQRALRKVRKKHG